MGTLRRVEGYASAFVLTCRQTDSNRGAFDHEINEDDRLLVVDHICGTCPKLRRSCRRRKDPLRAAPDGGYSSDVPQCSRGGRQSAPAACGGDRCEERGRDRYVDGLFRPMVLRRPSEDRGTLDDL